ncbi:P21 family protein [Tripterygium wilfordii]|uniref:P21 family protein n=1 Tax=Tripterygium wilfordii TaxID=458696 RepID=A0A7J7C784_TRIWF|nr:thaumatin-like protein 1 [Tripterygium wilfordii]KAF5729972.1 P21 family protein [Tripterygium wilfordii]
MNSKTNFLTTSTLLFTFLFISTNAYSNFTIINQCPYTVWAAAFPGGGRRLNQNESWTLFGSNMERIWGRTNCTFDASGRGHCETGDCNGLLECRGYGQPPNTLAEYALFSNQDLYDISLVDGFNIPIQFGPQPSSSCRARTVRCVADIKGECPAQLKAPGGCNHPCTVFKTNEYCCYQGAGSCGPTNFSRFFKSRCPDAYSFPQDDAASTLICPTGTSFRAVFCPRTGFGHDYSPSEMVGGI